MNEWYMYQPDSSIPTHFRISSLFLDILDTAKLFVVYDYIYIIYIWYLLCPAPSLLIFRYLDTHRNTNIFTPVAQHGDPLISKPVVPLWFPGHPGFWGAIPSWGSSTAAKIFPPLVKGNILFGKTMEDLFVWRFRNMVSLVSLKHFLLITQLHVYRETPWIPICQMTHTDLKPENILLAANAPPRRSDFPREEAWKDCCGAWGERKWNVVMWKWNDHTLWLWLT